MIRFVHAADLHLGAPFEGIGRMDADLKAALQEAPYRSLDRIVALAEAEDADFILLAGDLFDDSSRSVAAQARLAAALGRTERPVVMVYGNHDYAADQSLSIDYPANVHVLAPAGETLTVSASSGEEVAISGFSYDQRWIEDRRLPDFPARDSRADYQIGLFHGEEVAPGQPSHYAPFSRRELADKDYDYWALGHIHKRQQIGDLPAYYPGNIQGLNRTESGPKGCLLVELERDQCRAEFRQTAPFTWVSLTVDGRSGSGLRDWQRLVQEALPLDSRSDILAAVQLLLPADLSWEEGQQLADPAFLDLCQRKEAGQTSRAVSLSLLSEEGTDSGLAQLYPAAWTQAQEQVGAEENFNQLAEELMAGLDLTYAQLKGLLDLSDSTLRDELLGRARQRIQAGEGGAFDADH